LKKEKAEESQNCAFPRSNSLSLFNCKWHRSRSGQYCDKSQETDARMVSVCTYDW